MKIALSILAVAICLFLGWKFTSNTKIENLQLAKEGAFTMQRLVLLEAKRKLADAFPGGPKSESNASGSSGINLSKGKGQFEVLTADDIYWYESVDRSVVDDITAELNKLPEIREWIENAALFKQNRRVDFRVIGTDSRPILRVLFLCNNLSDGEVDSRAFLKNMWPN